MNTYRIAIVPRRYFDTKYRAVGRRGGFLVFRDTLFGYDIVHVNNIKRVYRRSALCTAVARLYENTPRRKLFVDPVVCARAV